MNKIFNYLIYKLSNILKHNRALIGNSYLKTARLNYHQISNLRSTEYKVFSQYGEDGIIDFILYMIGIKNEISFIEIGVQSYEEANTRFLAETKKSRGLLIDLDDQINFVKQRNFYWQNDMYVANTEVTSKNINSILEKFNFINSFDFLSLDIDGLDYWVLKEIDISKSKLVVAEYNPIFGYEKSLTIPNIKNFRRDNNHKSYFGMSIKALINLMKEKGFIFLGTNSACCNAFFVNFYYEDIFLKLQNLSMDKNVNFYFRENKFNNIEGNKIENILKRIKNKIIYDIEEKKKLTIEDIFFRN